MKKIVIISLIVLLLCSLLVGCNEPIEKIEGEETGNNNEEKIEKGDVVKLENKYANIENNPVVTMEMENGGVVKLELYPKIAPTTVENFVTLINSGFYDGLIFHRTIPGFMAQGGDPDGNGQGGPGYTIKGEFSNNSIENDISHVRGVLSMARQGNPYNPKSAYNTAGSQFFIMTSDYTGLDGDYAAFGKVIEGMEVVDEIVNSEVITRDAYSENADRPVNPPVIKKMTVETYGVEYTEPEKI